MTKDDIIRMAREAGFAVNEKARQHQPNCIFHTQYMVDELLERFAALVRADEREWVGLTDEEIHRTTVAMGFNPEWTTEIGVAHAIVRNLEAKLKERNT